MKNLSISFFFRKFVFISLLLFPQLSFGQTNNAPEISSVIIATVSEGTAETAINLVENSNKTIYIHGTVVDLDSCQEIDDVSGTSLWKVVFFRSDVTNAENCTPDNRDCYQDTEQNGNLSNCEGPSDTDLNYEMNISVAYYADATDANSSPDYSASNWVAFVEVTDDNEATDNLTSTIEMNTLKAIDISPSVDYGMIDLGSVSEEQVISITNTGNDNDLDPLINDANGWTCVRGTMGGEQVHFNVIAGQGWENGTAVTASPTDMGDLSLLKSSDGTPAITSLYTSLKMPESGLSGSCTSTLTIGAS